ncbi:Rpp14/Pop5 family-domain-containing protein [Polychytrium aggregatum]|uniref:Rpp14/Pop5 family-domain-containing protein n=1 Tax=Polychytrium aggregatum TaxID=110093 RepID=UPI0022FEDE60|nr:Rpp14/Pop5 family-domain-containing protein [Polychytrium aggregatum]KAI9204495.1 Rpp14/Pop5 family-domain-containing protein [Polychytrium aggregatum]
MRIKNRYLLFEIDFKDQLIVENMHGGIIAQAFKDSVEQNFGDYGAGSVLSSLSVKYFSPFTSVGIVRTGRDDFRMVWAALTFINQIRGRDCIIRVVHVGGTISKVQRAAIDLDRQLLGSLRRSKVIDYKTEESLQSRSQAEIGSIQL